MYLGQVYFHKRRGGGGRVMKIVYTSKRFDLKFVCIHIPESYLAFSCVQEKIDCKYLISEQNDHLKFSYEI